jgi:NarL family two-component system response regulator LiaR
VLSTVDTIRLYIIEGQILFAKALTQVFAEDPSIEIVGDAQMIDEALLSKARPSVILLDLDSVDMGYVNGLERCRAAAPDARICTLMMRPAPEIMQRCLAGGADGYVIKDVTPAELTRAIKLVASGSNYVDPRVAGGLMRRLANGGGRDFDELSVRETEVIRLIAEGLSNKEISARLILSEKTIKNHISRIFSKLNIYARSQAAVHAIKIGLL